METMPVSHVYHEQTKCILGANRKPVVPQAKMITYCGGGLQDLLYVCVFLIDLQDPPTEARQGSRTYFNNEEVICSTQKYAIFNSFKEN